jgi:hypothetical protein
MKRKFLRLAICLLVIGNSLFAQWGGSTTTSGDTYRDGNVGIGLSSAPASKLHLNITGSSTTTPQYGLLVNTNSFFTGDNANNSYFIKTIDAGSNFVPFIVKGNGSVGIRTDAPGSVLEVNITGAESVPQYGLLVKSNSFFTSSNAANSYFIKAIDAGSGFVPFVVKGNGQVGIGTENIGSFQLAVEGKIGAREIQVTVQNPFPDYVFGSNYKLRSLSSLEQYINQNKHLPGVPSADEVEKNGGVELGKLNTKLLEKVEELTLYMIEMKKENEKIKKENAQIKKEIKELKQGKSAH